MELIPNFAPSPLDKYRKKTSFDWKKMKLFIDTPEILKVKIEAYKFLETHPTFQHPDHDLTLDEERHITYQRIKTIYSSKIFYPDDYFLNVPKACVLGNIVGSYNWSLLARKGLLRDFAVSGIFGLGTERHMKYIASIMQFEMGFAFCLTEISHGTNTKGLRTEARYNRETQSFVLHTPDFEAAKCWAGCLGKTASHCLVFAQLYTPDGTCHGLHCFIVPVRDTQTLQPYPGVTIIDMGPKLGLNGIDNGVIMFNHYSVPRENLLNKIGDVSPEGKYISAYKDPNKRFGAALGNLSIGRINIISFGVVNLNKALTIAIRYSAVRRQFGPDDAEEIPVLEYPLQQWRLFPYLGGLYALAKFGEGIQKHQADFTALMMEAKDPDRLALYGQELHALSSAGKPYAGWFARDAIQECREACGGHGYLKASGFGELRDDNDANCTYEGDNNVLLQQTSNWLLSLWNKRHHDCCAFPMGTTDFFGKGDSILSLKWSERTSFHLNMNDDDLVQRCLEGFEWLICWLCQRTSSEVKKEQMEKSIFEARNNSQIFRAHTLSIAYVERVIVLWLKMSLDGADKNLQPPLKRLCALFALTRLIKHVSLLFEGGLLYNQGLIMTDIHQHIKRLLTELLPDAVSLIDAFAPPDFILRSVLGCSDGKVYDHLYSAMITSPGALTRDKYWKEMSYNKPQSKL